MIQWAINASTNCMRVHRPMTIKNEWTWKSLLHLRNKCLIIFNIKFQCRSIWRPLNRHFTDLYNHSWGFFRFSAFWKKVAWMVLPKLKFIRLLSACILTLSVAWNSWANKIFTLGYYHVNPKLCLKIAKSAWLRLYSFT